MSERVLVVCQHFWPESFRINDITDYLVGRGCEVDVLCGIPNYPKGKYFEGYGVFRRRHEHHGGVNIRRATEIPRGGNSNARIFLNYISFPAFSLLHIPRIAFGQKYDVIFIYQLSPVMMALPGVIIGLVTRVPTVMYVLDLWPENLYSVLPIRSVLLRRLLATHSNWYYRRVDKLLALSEEMRQRLISVTGKSPRDVVVIPQASEKLYETPIEDLELAGRFSETFNVVFTGNISPAQSFDTMIDAASILKARGRGDIKWIVVGDGMSRAEVESEVLRRGLSGEFAFEGHVAIADVPRYTFIADVLVGCLAPSELLGATVPAKVMSYIASGRTIVLAMDGEARRLVNEEIKCGFAGPAGDSKALADNVERAYLLTTEARREPGERAREYHFRHFERNIVLGELHAVLRSIASSSPA